MNRLTLIFTILLFTTSTITAFCLAHLPVPNALISYNLLSPIPDLFHATGSVAALSCNLGFVINGSSTTKCTAKGIWEPKLGSCVVISDALSNASTSNLNLTCGPVNHTTGTITYIPNSESRKFQTGALALLTCPFGQEVNSGASHATCQDGKWSAKLGSCANINFKIFF
uniref:Sushi domain-containing protein n=1 Tax=Elaeophora elaphi TaxID=1147741 RepID=A0A0R3RPB6_9BILA